MSPPSVKGSRPREFQGTAEASGGSRELRSGWGARTLHPESAWAARTEKLSGEGGGGDREKEPETQWTSSTPTPHRHAKTRGQLTQLHRRLQWRGKGRSGTPGWGPAQDAGPLPLLPSPPSERRCGAEARALCTPPAANSAKTTPSTAPPRGPAPPGYPYLSRVGLGLRRLEEGVGQLAKPHGHGLRHVGRLGVHDGIEERLQVGLRVPADVHDLVAGRGCGRGRGGPGRRHGRRRGALRGRLGRRLLRGLHGCGLVRRSGHCAQVRGAATRARIALHSLPEAASPLLPSPPRAPSFLPFFAPGRGGVPTETETLAPDAQTKKLRGAPARAPRGLRLLDALPSSARPPAPNPRPAAPGETFPARRYIPADSRPHVTRGRPRCVRTHRPAPSRSAAGADPAGPARNAKAARNRDNRLGRVDAKATLFTRTKVNPVRVLTLIPFTTKFEEETTKHLRAGANDFKVKLGNQELHWEYLTKGNSITF